MDAPEDVLQDACASFGHLDAGAAEDVFSDVAFCALDIPAYLYLLLRLFLVHDSNQDGVSHIM